MDIDDIVHQVDSKMPWPEVEFLFGEDEEYQCIIAEIMHNVTISIQNVTSAADVNNFLSIKRINFDVNEFFSLIITDLQKIL